MEYRFLGKSGLQVPVLSFGTATFGGEGDFFKAWGSTQADEAKKLINICLDAGVNLFDTADIYSDGKSEEVLGEAIKGISRDKLILSTKSTFTFGENPLNQGSSRTHILKQIEGSLKRLGTDYIDIYHMHGFDGNTPVEETLKVLDELVTSGKVRYIAASNFSGWGLMKSVGVSEKYGWSKYIAHQVYYSLANREYEWELMPLGLDQNVGAIVWSPLSSGRLSGKYGRNKPIPQDSRIAQGGSPVPEAVVQEEIFYNTIDALEEVAAEVGKNVAQVALNWLLQRPTVSSIIIGARNEEQLKQNLEAVGWNLTREQVEKLDKASEVPPIYPYWHQWQNKRLNPTPDFYSHIK
ncbi:aryl-alcohol dehydrogenase-like predicted oxidoreductase [Chryseobacterium ginsenosidimutans]|uniref:aldo/keto reductase n=1 Tax=Chryseobacterium ginsenosidimutans TaxID=687846 RepID=UPI0021689A5A|nr:aldo/keto reductase [Chryseobacterium ginsenosidimutans]MCS3869879.1 aryl-alcohol dehydrogenase-like predicted oxidoreductase [Chryseobacterium ginsenosidimutans]